MGVVLFGYGIEAAARIAGLADEEVEIGHGYGVFFSLGLRQKVITEYYGRGLGIGQEFWPPREYHPLGPR